MTSTKPKLTEPHTGLLMFPPLRHMTEDAKEMKRTYRSHPENRAIRAELERFFRVDAEGKATTAHGTRSHLSERLLPHVYHGDEPIEIIPFEYHDIFIGTRVMTCGQQRMLAYIFRQQVIPMQYIARLIGVSNSVVANAARRRIDVLMPCTLDQFIYDIHRTNSMSAKERMLNTRDISTLEGTDVYKTFKESGAHSPHAPKYELYAHEYERGRLMMDVDYRAILNRLRGEPSTLPTACNALIISPNVMYHDDRRGENTYFTYQQQGMITWLMRFMSYKLLARLLCIRHDLLFALKARYNHAEHVIPCSLEDMISSMEIYPPHRYAFSDTKRFASLHLTCI